MLEFIRYPGYRRSILEYLQVTSNGMIQVMSLDRTRIGFKGLLEDRAAKVVFKVVGKNWKKIGTLSWMMDRTRDESVIYPIRYDKRRNHFMKITGRIFGITCGSRGTSKLR